jgi:hypothetical protein
MWPPWLLADEHPRDEALRQVIQQAQALAASDRQPPPQA